MVIKALTTNSTFHRFCSFPERNVSQMFHSYTYTVCVHLYGCCVVLILIITTGSIELTPPSLNLTRTPDPASSNLAC